MKLKDKVVLITGGGSGLGREMGLTFAREGAKIGVNDIRPESAQNVVTEIERAGGKAHPFVADVSSSAAVAEDVQGFYRGVWDYRYPGQQRGHRTEHARQVIATPTHEKTDEDWHKMLATHLDSTFYCTREALKVMIPKQSGRIIKHWIHCGHDWARVRGGLLRGEGRDNFVHQIRLRAKWCPLGILVNCIAPGFIDTPMTSICRRRDAQADRSDHADWALRRAARYRGGGAVPGVARIRSSWSARC